MIIETVLRFAHTSTSQDGSFQAVVFRSAGSNGSEGHFRSPEGITRASCRNNSPC
ncbi:hypothetical protein [Ruminococcus bicirculans (ex Wegman et al. 2014)]|uniref:hypothetical protein n=1 Tax=Ruminococcus bicirculans (ex Wegman et al. 2014) TaxID=1160721 RepID=UPI0039933208